MSFETTIREIIDRTVREVAAAVRAEISGRFGEPDAAPGRRRGRPPKLTAGTTAKRAARGPVKRTYPPHCLAPNCKRPHRGPRFTFMCADHDNLGKAQKRKLLAAWKAQTKR